ncbi:MAG: TOTE conflict system archaeo-eukaryotic primase domain-containing protein [Terracidiphilus sp.]
MYAKFCVNREAANNFMRLFVNRRAYAIQAERPLPNGSVPYYPARDWKTKEPKPLDEGVVRMHLNGDITVSLYAINPETQRSKWVAIDADFDGSLESLFQLQWELKQDGVDAALEQSRRGGHLWIFAAEPLLASECRIYVYNLALRLGIPVKGGGLKEGIEVFLPPSSAVWLYPGFETRSNLGKAAGNARSSCAFARQFRLAALHRGAPWNHNDLHELGRVHGDGLCWICQSAVGVSDWHGPGGRLDPGDRAVDRADTACGQTHDGSFLSWGGIGCRGYCEVG